MKKIIQQEKIRHLSFNDVNNCSDRYSYIDKIYSNIGLKYKKYFKNLLFQYPYL